MRGAWRFKRGFHMRRNAESLMLYFEHVVMRSDSELRSEQRTLAVGLEGSI